MIKRIFFTILMSIAFATPALAGVNVVTTLPWIGSIAREIGKDMVSITVLVKPSQDPHFVEAKPSMILAASKADIIMYNGLDLEIGYLPLIVNSSRNPRIQSGKNGNLDCSKYINPIDRPKADMDRSMGDVHPFGNPHYHLSAKNVLSVAEGMAKTLGQADPKNASFYMDNLKGFSVRVKQAQGRWAGKLKGKRFIAYHKYFEYLAYEHGFEIAGYIEPKPGIPTSSGHIADLIEKIKSTKPDGLLTTSYYGRKEVAFLSNRTGVRAVTVPHEVGSGKDISDWISLMDNVVESLR